MVGKGLGLALVVALLVAPGGRVAHADDDDAIRARADKLNEEGKDLFGSGELDAAAQKFRAAIALTPQARYYFNLCFVLNARGELERALGACKQAETADGVDADLRKRARDFADGIEKKIRDKPTPPDPVDRPADPPPDDPPPDDPPEIKPMPGAQPGASPPTRGPPPPGFRAPPVVAEKPLPPKRRHFGVIAGLSLASLTNDDDALDVGIRPGIAVGLFAATSLSRRIASQVEVLYVQKGTRVEFFGDSADLTLHYLSFPLVAKWFFGGRAARVHLDAGMALSILMSADAEGTDITEDTAAFDLGFILGVGLTWHRPGANALTLDVRYESGLLDIDDAAMESVNNRATSLRIGYAF